MTLTIGSLFSGIGGLELGLERAGLGPVLWQCEVDPFCRRVLAKHWPTVTRFEDVTQPRDYPHVDVICGGFPCQDVSAAGLGAGLGGRRSGLWHHFASIVAKVRPSWVVVENVASGARRWLPTVRGNLHVLGYDSTAYAISAADVGAPHRRRRVFVLAHADGVQRRTPARSHQARHPRSGSLSRSEALLADPDCEGQLQQGGAIGSERGRARDGRDEVGGQWAFEPGMGRVAHGVPARMDRLSALGNAVVPQCAEVVGRVIRGAA